MKKALSIVHPEIQSLILTVVVLGAIGIIAYGIELLNGGNFHTFVNL